MKKLLLILFILPGYTLAIEGTSTEENSLVAVLLQNEPDYKEFKSASESPKIGRAITKRTAEVAVIPSKEKRLGLVSQNYAGPVITEQITASHEQSSIWQILLGFMGFSQSATHIAKK